MHSLFAVDSEGPSSWWIILPVGLGFLATICLMPRPTRRPAGLGALCALGALAGLGLLLTRAYPSSGTFDPETFLFIAFSTMIVVFGGLMITQRNPARAALSFAIVTLSNCGLFLLLAAPFLMAATIIIYAGAIIVTFLFLLMLSQQKGATDADDRSREPFLASLVGFGMLGLLLVVLTKVYGADHLDATLHKVEKMSQMPDVASINDAIPTDDEKKDFFRKLEEISEQVRGAESLEKSREEYDQAVPELRSLIAPTRGFENPDIEQELPRIRELLTTITRHGRSFREALVNGTAFESDAVTLSPHGRPRPFPVPAKEDEGASTPPPPGSHRLPARNVAALGRSLFTDHLLAVELAGTLLLVATIGTIIIARDDRREKAAS
jgi:NADH:ubiquinone oxidoreductase subunit 6 (subunit J)